MSCKGKSTLRRFDTFAQSCVSWHMSSSGTHCHASCICCDQVDGTSERVLLSRFSVNGFPMIFHIQGADTRQFNGKRTFVKVMLIEHAGKSLYVLQHCPASMEGYLKMRALELSFNGIPYAKGITPRAATNTHAWGHACAVK